MSRFVHEVYMRLVDVDRMTLKNRTHFFAVAARLMRQILVDHARRKRADKRGAGPEQGPGPEAEASHRNSAATVRSKTASSA